MAADDKRGLGTNSAPIKLEDHLASKALNINWKLKKQDEEEVIRGFLSRIGLTEPGLESRERPDFLVDARGRVRIACEVARYFSDEGSRGSIERRFFRLWTDFALSLKRRLSEEGMGHMYGAIHFRDANRIEIPPEKAFMEEIIRALRSPYHGEVVGAFEPANFPILASTVDHICVRDTSPECGILWWCAHLQSGLVESSAHILWNQVEKKDEEASSYEWPECREKWLVIYAAARGLADCAPKIDSSQPTPRVAHFDRVFFWDRFFETIYQLAPSVLTVLEYPKLYIHRLPECLRG